MWLGLVTAGLVVGWGWRLQLSVVRGLPGAGVLRCRIGGQSILAPLFLPVCRALPLSQTTPGVGLRFRCCYAGRP